MVFYAQSDVPCISVQALLEKHCLSQSAGINKFAVWFFLLADDVVYLEQCFLKTDNEISCLQAFGFQDIKIRQTAHYSAANDLPGLKKLRFSFVFSFSFHYFWLPLHWRLLKHAILAGLIVCRHASCRACVSGTACFVHVVFLND